MNGRAGAGVCDNRIGPPCGEFRPHPSGRSTRSRLIDKLLPLIVFAAIVCAVRSAQGAEETVLIQLQPDASYRLWYSEGERQPSDDDLNRMSALATNDGKRVALGNRYGKAFQTPLGVVAVIWTPVERH